MSVSKISLIILFSCCCACGSRKMNKQQQELNLKSKEVTQADAQLHATVLATNKAEAASRQERNYTYHQGKVVPVDPTKPTRFTDPAGNTTTVENGILEFGTGTDNTVTESRGSSVTQTKTDVNASQSQQQQKDFELKNKQAAKTVDREGAGKDVATGAAWICFLIMLVLVVAWLIKRRFYDKD